MPLTTEGRERLHELAKDAHDRLEAAQDELRQLSSIMEDIYQYRRECAEADAAYDTYRGTVADHPLPDEDERTFDALRDLGRATLPQWLEPATIKHNEPLFAAAVAERGPVNTQGGGR